MTDLLLNREHYETVIQREIPQAEKFVWIATADIKDLHIERGGKGKYQPFLQLLADLLQDGVEIRLIHAKEPGPRFREDFDRFPELIESELFERVLCPRMHMKVIIIDGKAAYTGSANLTGAGIGSKSPHRRNFEAGIFTRDPEIVSGLMEFYDEFWIGSFCEKCGRRDVCPDPIL
ncbi:MAG: phosphatidylserine synthase [Verrucomicrobiales bacterium]|nr:phosphatidylserine synthase [Verrucomicrobiales bacterium]